MQIDEKNADHEDREDAEEFRKQKPSNIKSFNANHPFAFFIVETINNTILNMGTVIDNFQTELLK